MDGCRLGFREYFDNVVCVRTFHFLPEPLSALRGMRQALVKDGKCLVSFESDNPIRRLAIFFKLGGVNQRYYRTGDVEQFFRETGFRVIDRGSVMRIPVLIWRRCPKHLIRLMAKVDRLWPWPMHDFVLGKK